MFSVVLDGYDCQASTNTRRPKYKLTCAMPINTTNIYPQFSVVSSPIIIIVVKLDNVVVITNRFKYG